MPITSFKRELLSMKWFPLDLCYLLCLKKGKNQNFKKKNKKMFWRFAEIVYLCIRFRTKKSVAGVSDRSLKCLHRQRSSTRSGCRFLLWNRLPGNRTVNMTLSVLALTDSIDTNWRSETDNKSSASSSTSVTRIYRNFTM